MRTGALSQVFLKRNYNAGLYGAFSKRKHFLFVGNSFLFLERLSRNHEPHIPLTLDISHLERVLQQRFLVYISLAFYTPPFKTQILRPCVMEDPPSSAFQRSGAEYQSRPSPTILVLEEIRVQKESISDRMTFLSLNTRHHVSFLHSRPNPPRGSAA